MTKKYGNLEMCYVDDVVIATPTLEDHIERLDEVFACMKRSGLKCKPSKCEILKDLMKYLGRMLDRHGISSKENKGAEGKQTKPATEIDLETPDQSVDEVEKKTTESTPMPNAEERNQKSMELSPIDTVEDTTGNTPETVKYESQVKKNVIHREDGDDGWDEVERRCGVRTESRERQNIWNSFHDNNRGQPR